MVLFEWDGLNGRGTNQIVSVILKFHHPANIKILILLIKGITGKLINIETRFDFSFICTLNKRMNHEDNIMLFKKLKMNLGD